MNRNVSISFVLTIYNNPFDYINRCVNSIYNQTDDDFEILIVDDGSNLHTASFCDKYNNSNTKVVHQKNGGLSVARNTGLDNAKGRYIAYIDPDDWIENDFVETIKKHLLNDTYDILAYGHWEEYLDRKKICLEETESLTVFNEAEKIGILHALFQRPEYFSKYGMFFGAQWKMVYSRDFLKKNNIRNTPGILKAQDMLFCIDAVIKASKMGYIRKALYHYNRCNQDSVTSSLIKNPFSSDMLIYELRKLLDINDCERELYCSMCYYSLLTFMGLFSNWFYCSKNSLPIKDRIDLFYRLLESPGYSYIISNDYTDSFTAFKKIQLSIMKKRSFWGMSALFFMFNVKNTMRK